MQNGIAIVSIAATATVAIAVPIINAQAERIRLRSQLQNERLGELRGVLDLAALALSRADEALRVAELAVEISQGSAVAESQEQAAETALSEVDHALHEVSNQRARLSLRLGHETEIAVAFGRALDALREQRDVLKSAFLGGPLSDDPKGWKEVVVPLDRARQNFERAQWTVSDLAAQLISPFSDAASGFRLWLRGRSL